MNANIFEKANRIVNGATEAYIGLIDDRGSPSVSTVSSIRADGIFKGWFATGMDANKTKRILANPKASVCYRREGDNVTLVGEAKIRTDETIRHELWQDWFINHFPQGKDDPNYCVIEFETRRAALWVENESAEFAIADLLTVQSRCGLLCMGCSWREPCHCGGCAETNGHPFHGECPIAMCCQRKGYAHCGECADMPCDKLYAYSFTDAEHGDKPAGARISVLKYWKQMA